MLAAILGNSALAGLTAWRDVPAMAFELAWLPRPMRRPWGPRPATQNRSGSALDRPDFSTAGHEIRWPC